MKVIVGVFYLECNTFNPILTTKDSYVFAEGKEMLNRIHVCDIFEEAGIEIVPTISAVALPAGIMKEEDFWYFTNKILDVAKKEKNVDGIWLHLHGAMEVENIGPGDLKIVQELREIVGNDIPIGIALDAHANNDKSLNEYVNIIRGYRTIPHQDQPETERVVARGLVKFIKEKQNIKPALITLPMIVSGEKGLAGIEPLKSLFEKLDEYEEKEEIFTSSVFMGDPWADCPNSHLSVTVTPSREEHSALAQKLCRELADEVWRVRKEFDFEVPAIAPRDALDMAYEFNDKPIFISDSGDNTTGGAVGQGTEMLRLLLREKDFHGKKVLVTAIHDEKAYELCKDYHIEDAISIEIGSGFDDISQPVKVEGILKTKGKTLGYLLCDEDDVSGRCCTISIGDMDVVISNEATSFITLAHFKAAGLDWRDYDIIVLKQGYLFVELEKVSKLAILAVTKGATYQYIEDLDYKRLQRPIFPLDAIEELIIK